MTANAVFSPMRAGSRSSNCVRVATLGSMLACSPQQAGASQRISSERHLKRLAPKTPAPKTRSAHRVFTGTPTAIHSGKEWQRKTHPSQLAKSLSPNSTMRLRLWDRAGLASPRPRHASRGNRSSSIRNLLHGIPQIKLVDRTHMYTCISICMCICISVHAHARTNVHLHTFVCLCAQKVF